MSAPRTSHLDDVHHLLRYLKATPGQGILFSSTSQITLKAYADADWGSCPDSRRSTTGICVFLGDSLVSWKSQRQHVVSRSPAEAEYRALASIASEVTWLNHLLVDFEINIGPTLLFCDNQAAIHIASNPTFHERSKHMEIDCHFIRDKVTDSMLRLVHVNSKHQLADILTKTVPTPLFTSLLSKMGIYSIYDPP